MALSDAIRLARRSLQTYAIILALACIWVFFAFLTDGAYLSPQNLSNLFRQMTVTAFLGIGMVLVIVIGGIDLSVGKLAGFVSVVVVYFQAYVWTRVLPNQPIVAATLTVFIGLAVGAAAGLVQGYIISYLKVPAFIVTLGSMFTFDGALLLVTQGRTIPANQPALTVIAQGYLPKAGGWLLACLTVALLHANMLRSRQRKRKYASTCPSFPSTWPPPRSLPCSW